MEGLERRPKSLDQVSKDQQGWIQRDARRICAMKFRFKGVDCHWDRNEVLHYILRVVRVPQEEEEVRNPSDVVVMLSSAISGGYRVIVSLGES